MNRGLNAINWALNARGISPTAFRVLMHLVSFVNGSDGKRQDYDVWPSKTELADLAEISVSGVKRHLKELVDEGFIEIIPWQHDNGTSTSNTYRICVVTTHEMPDGSTIRSGRPAGVQSEPLPEGGGGQDWTGEGSTVEPPRNLESEPSNLPPHPTGEAPPKVDLSVDETTPLSGELFNNPGLLAATKPSIIEYVKAGWDSFCDDFPRTHRVMAWSDSRKKAIARRAAEIVQGTTGALDAYQVWDMIFAALRADKFWRGESDPGRGYSTAYAAKIDHVLRPRDFAQILEKAATNDRDTAATSDPVTGREYGPAEQAARRALARLLADRQ